jgi:hypothetical protein
LITNWLLKKRLKIKAIGWTLMEKTEYKLKVKSEKLKVKSDTKRVQKAQF